MTKIREIVDAQSTHTLEPSEDHTESVADFGEEFLSTLQPIIRFQGLISAFHKPIVQLPKFDFSVSRVFSHCHRRLATNLRNSSLGPVTEFSRKLEKLRRHNDVLDKSGWLPHYSTPFGLVDDCDTDSEALHRRTSARIRGTLVPKTAPTTRPIQSCRRYLLPIHRVDPRPRRLRWIELEV